MSSSFFAGKKVVVTGGAGSVGAEIVRHLLRADVSEVRALDNHEADLFALEHQLDGDPRAHLFFADVRNEEKMQRMFEGMDYVGLDIMEGENVDVVGDAHALSESVGRNRFDGIGNDHRV